MAKELEDILVTPLNPDALAIHDNTFGQLPVGRLSTGGEHGDDPVHPTHRSVAAYDPAEDDLPRWRTLNQLFPAVPDEDMAVTATEILGATSVLFPLETEGQWRSIAGADFGGGALLADVSGTATFSLNAVGSFLRDVQFRLIVDGTVHDEFTVTFATDGAGGAAATVTWAIDRFQLAHLDVHTVDIEAYRLTDSVDATVYMGAGSLTMTVIQSVFVKAAVLPMVTYDGRQIRTFDGRPVLVSISLE
jgi:hypothetical protein